MNKFFGKLKQKCVEDQKNRKIYLALLGVAYALGTLFFILLLISVCAPSALFTDRDTFDRASDELQTYFDPQTNYRLTSSVYFRYRMLGDDGVYLSFSTSAYGADGVTFTLQSGKVYAVYNDSDGISAEYEMNKDGMTLVRAFRGSTERTLTTSQARTIEEVIYDTVYLIDTMIEYEGVMDFTFTDVLEEYYDYGSSVAAVEGCSIAFMLVFYLGAIAMTVLYVIAKKQPDDTTPAGTLSDGSQPRDTQYGDTQPIETKPADNQPFLD